MSSLWTDLLFMHGHITNLDLARRLAETPPASKPTGKRKRSPKADRRVAEKATPALATRDCLPT
jgi:hypothetical protein